MITISGWFLDRAPFFPIILDFIAPNYVAVKQVVEILDSGEKAIVSSDHLGSKVLLKWWKPPLTKEDIKTISGIGRSTGVLDLPNARQFYEIRLLVQSNTKMIANNTLHDAEVKKMINDELNNTIIKWSAWMFFGGLLLSFVTVIWEYCSKNNT